MAEERFLLLYVVLSIEVGTSTLIGPS